MEDKNRVEVITGIFRNPRKVEKVGVVVSLNDKDAIRMNRKSMWACLRSNFSRAIDGEIKSQKRDGTILEDFFIGAFKTWKHKPKPMQFFVKGNKCFGAASLKHSVVMPDKIYAVFNKALKKHNLVLEEKDGISGRVALLHRSNIARFGFKIDAGNIFTEKAIKISSYVEMIACLNPLSFVGINKGIVMSTAQPVKVRLLRYESLTKIPDRIDEAIEAIRPELAKIEAKIKEVQKTEVTPDQAKKIIAAFGVAYGIGATVLKAVFERFENEEKATIFGLSMAFSYIPQHEQDIFRENATVAKQSLSTLAGAVLLMDNVNKTVRLCNDRIKHEPAMQVCLARINGKLPMRGGKNVKRN